jgi:two-component system chemotaxis response regulator CheY
VEQKQPVEKVFIVNDDKQLLDMYALEFKDQGFDVVPAYGSVDAIEKLRGGVKPDVILLDVTAPVLDSFELLSILREEKLVENAKVIILSNDNVQALDEKSRALGVSGYIEKTSTIPSQVVQNVMTIMNKTASSPDNT